MTLSRRDFLKGAATAGAAAVLPASLLAKAPDSLWFAGPAVEPHGLVAYSALNGAYTWHPYSVSMVIQKEAFAHDRYGVLRRMLGLRTDARINRRLRREQGRAARGVGSGSASK